MEARIRRYNTHLIRFQQESRENGVKGPHSETAKIPKIWAKQGKDQKNKKN